MSPSSVLDHSPIVGPLLSGKVCVFDYAITAQTPDGAKAGCHDDGFAHLFGRSTESGGNAETLTSSVKLFTRYDWAWHIDLRYGVCTNGHLRKQAGHQ